MEASVGVAMASLGAKVWSGAKWLVPVAVVAGAAWFAVAIVGNPAGETKTYGRILVDTPEIYTRERLVDDRFQQEAWLARQLAPKEGVHSGESFLTDDRGVGLKVGGAGGGSSTSTPTPASDQKGEGRSETTKQPEAGAAPRDSSRARLLAEMDYRELVRNLTIENQLDDRHDLNGNSLYKLKFDASVLPGAHTQASAQITVRVREPEFVSELAQGSEGTLARLGSEKSITVWRTLYRRWIESLGVRLNQTHKELKHVFHNSESSHTDYARLIDFLGRHLGVSVPSVASCTKAMVNTHTENPLPLGT